MSQSLPPATVYRLIAAFFCLAMAIGFSGCGSGTTGDSSLNSLDGEALARRHCQGCHAFVPPDRLDKTSWREGVLPRMAHYLGIRTPPYAQIVSMGEARQMREAGIFPPEPLVDTTDWKKIVDYFYREAPDSLPLTTGDTLRYDRSPIPFQPRTIDLGLDGGALTSLLHWAPRQALMYVGDGRNQLFRIDGEGKVIDLHNLDSPPVAVVPSEEGGAHILTVGFLRPNNTPGGRLVYLRPDGALQERLQEALRGRWLTMECDDFNHDGQNDLALGSFIYSPAPTPADLRRSWADERTNLLMLYGR